MIARSTIHESRIMNQGFTLLEVLIATLLFTVGIIGIMSAFNAGIFAISDVENVNLALNLAQKKMEEITVGTYPGIASEPKAVIPDLQNLPVFEQQVDVSTPQTGFKQVKTTIYWDTKGGETSVSLTTLVTDYQ